MKNYLLIIMTVLGLSAVNITLASESATDTAHPETLPAKPFGDAAAGKNKAASCGACHGRQGNSTQAINPKLAGQSAHYIFKQLNDFKSGARSNAIMAGQAAGLGEQDMKDIAAYYAEQETSLGTVKKEYLELGQKIYRAGNAETGLPACIACHGPAGKGMASAGFPALAGQHVQYTKAQLSAFRAAGRGDHGKGAKRTNDGLEGEAVMMQDVAAKMSDDEIEAVSSYLFGLR